MLKLFTVKEIQLIIVFQCMPISLLIWHGLDDVNAHLLAYEINELLVKIFKDEIYVLNHENLVEDQEKYSKEIIKYCELEWDDSCLEFYKTAGQVQTASNEQVREPINKAYVIENSDFIKSELKKSLNL